MDLSKKNERLSKDGQWRSFPKVPHLLQYVSNGNYYGRIKVKGKLFRVSLNTKVWSTAKLLLTDFLKEHQGAGGLINPPNFDSAVELFKLELESNTAIKPQSKQYRLWCLGKIKKTWQGLGVLPLNQITVQGCRDWAAKLHKEIACHYYNNTISTLKQVIEAGIKGHKANGGGSLDNPAADLKRARVKQKELKLPETSQFKSLVENIRTKSGGSSQGCGDLVEFLSYSGLRVDSEAAWVTGNDLDWKRKEIIVRGDPDTATKNSEIRRVPIFQNMEDLLERMQKRYGAFGTEPILKVNKCSVALARACKEIGIPKLTHHDLRHLFATRCIESGVDIPTVSRWLGHKDGGALAMKTYGHLRNEHSQAMALKVKF